MRGQQTTRHNKLQSSSDFVFLSPVAEFRLPALPVTIIILLLHI